MQFPLITSLLHWSVLLMELLWYTGSKLIRGHSANWPHLSSIKLFDKLLVIIAWISTIKRTIHKMRKGTYDVQTAQAFSNTRTTYRNRTLSSGENSSHVRLRSRTSPSFPRINRWTQDECRQLLGNKIITVYTHCYKIIANRYSLYTELESGQKRRIPVCTYTPESKIINLL